MKTQEEIEQLAENHYSQITLSQRTAFKFGYTQCQKDNKDKKYTEEDMKHAMFVTLISNNINSYKDIKDYINSLNKQD